VTLGDARVTREVMPVGNSTMDGRRVTEPKSGSEYAVSVADASYQWYRAASIRARRLYRGSELAVIVISALIPLSAVVIVNNVAILALLGSIVVVITGLRSVFHWHENYLRFSRAREAVEAERRKYRIGVEPYSTVAERDMNLVQAVTRIEQEEMGNWLQLAESPVTKTGSVSP